MSINIVLAPDDNYSKHAAVVICSALQHNKAFINFWILDGGISDKNKKMMSQFIGFDNYAVHFVKINTGDFADFPESGYITRAMWYRLKVASLLPESVDTCLYLDCDTIVNDSLDDLFSLDMDNAYVATAIDCIYTKFLKNHKKYFSKDYLYFNSGVLLINLKMWRKENVEKQIFEYIKSNPQSLKLLDQTILNITLQNRKIELPIKYNFQYTPRFLGETSYFARRHEYRAAAKHPSIIHFVGEFKPWKIGYNAVNVYYKKYFEALRMTSWRISPEEESEIIAESEKNKNKILVRMLFKLLKKKPYHIFRKYFWHRLFLDK